MIEIQTINNKYCNSLTEYSRYKTRVVHIGDVPLGGSYPVRIQSMTTTDTMDTNATVEQSIRMIEAGAEYVRITAPALKEAVNLDIIKRELRARGYNTPLIADIHFTPNAAEQAARIVEKVRVNPGNYADRKRFKVFSFTDEMYNEELERIREKFSPLVKICKEYGTAMRIGTNHGSLSDRIMNRYGDTPYGMVESALEFVRICEELDYHEIVLSMKASNAKIMVEAYRLLVSKMEEESMNYPIHLGVTEAGDGIDGRIKSAIGIGSLLEDGIGDTIRVSLTEEPEAEMPPAIKLVKRLTEKTSPKTGEHGYIPEITYNPIEPFNFKRRETYTIDNIGGHHPPVVILNGTGLQAAEQMSEVGYEYDSNTDKWKIADIAPDFVYLGEKDINFSLPVTLKKIFNYSFWLKLENRADSYPILTKAEYLNPGIKSDKLNFIKIELGEVDIEFIETIKKDKTCALILSTSNFHGIAEMRRVFIELINHDVKSPVIIYRKIETIDEEEYILYNATDAGALLLDGLGDGIFLESTNFSLNKVNEISFGILQATRTRISKTEYISCPSCGRTQFDLQVTTAMIREKTNHLKGVKIAIMGCIVNGPGEMADADYGFVGSGPGWVSLYRGKDVIERGIPYENALDKLINIIKEDGVWVESN